MLVLASLPKPKPQLSHKKNICQHGNNTKHILNMHKGLLKCIKDDIVYIEQNCTDKLDVECVVRWDRIASISKSTKDLLNKHLNQ